MSETVEIGDRVETVPELGPGEVVHVKGEGTVIVRYDNGEQHEHRVEELKPAG